ncbi:thioredoxin family protein [Roseivirga echinicomitans]|uniref:Alkyl hydroperoxide reductase n=1 Tax=Roseivirga echinicomitans TaxID=296218 RepID=A0A150XUE7_9BACT|nr:thioredoxin family protein [Roseivirga echinicomitans]KYG82379.1 alkyl hydroperoxide reductase [Roseivirga echinicomitans]
MSRIPSNMLPLGTTAPDFKLLDTVSGQMLSLNELKSDKATVIMFICNHCPFVKHVDEGIVALAKDYQVKGVSFIAISSNDVENYPQDSPDLMKVEAEKVGYTFPYLFDETQEVAKAYQAACTPDFYVFDAELKCVYRGQFDDSRPGNGLPVTGKELRSALDCVLNNEKIDFEQRPSVGCNIKWKVG